MRYDMKYKYPLATRFLEETGMTLDEALTWIEKQKNMK